MIMILYNKDSKYAEAFEYYDIQRSTFNTKLIEQGVKAFRPNDGWVNRERLSVIFFKKNLYGNNPCDTMYYHPEKTLQVGDLIFIGDYLNGGRYAKIEKVWSNEKDSCAYNYSPQDYVDGYDYKYITRRNYPRKDTSSWERINYRLGLYEPEFVTDIY